MQINEKKPKKDNLKLMRKLTWFFLIFFGPIGVALLFVYYPEYSQKKKFRISIASIIFFLIVMFSPNTERSTVSNNQQVAEQITFETTTKEATTSELTTKEITTKETTTKESTTAEATTIIETTQETTPAPTAEVVAAIPVDTAPAIAETPVPETQPIETQPVVETLAPQSQERGVWVCSNGKKYHSNPDCSNMAAPYQLSLSEAEAQGYTACKKCY